MPEIALFEKSVYYEYSPGEELGRKIYEYRDPVQDDPILWAQQYCREHDVGFVLLRRLPKPYVSIWELYYTIK